MKKIIYYIVVVIVSIILIVNLFSIFNTSIFGFRVFRIASGSMSPIYKVNDLILVKKTNNYKVGQIVTFKNQNNEYVTHRIVEIKNNKLVTKGESNNTYDNPITKKDIIGRVVYRSRVISVLNKLFTSSLFWLIVPFFAIIIMIIPRKKEDAIKVGE